MDKIDKILLSIIIVCVMVLVTILVISNKKPLEKKSELPKVEIKLEQPEFFLEDTPTKELISRACAYYNIHHIDIVVAQAILETGYFRSENCKVNNNLFGLYNSKKKEYFKFDHWTSCVKAYRDMIQYRYKPNEDYYNFLKRIGYAEDSLYNQKVKSIVTESQKK